MRMRANFTMKKSEINLGKIVSQSVELEYIDVNGEKQIANCDNCMWTNESLSVEMTDLKGLIGPLMRDVTYAPVIRIKSEYKLEDQEGYKISLSDKQCVGNPFTTALWQCDNKEEEISASQVCDNPIEPDCTDGSDEAEFRYVPTFFL